MSQVYEVVLICENETQAEFWRDRLKKQSKLKLELRKVNPDAHPE